MKECEIKWFQDEIKKQYSEINELKKELLEIYKCLYPEWRDVIKMQKESLNFLPPEKVNFLVDSSFLDLIRDHHKEQLEKEKIKKLIKKCMGEIKE